MFCCPTRTEKTFKKFLESIEHLFEADIFPVLIRMKGINTVCEWLLGVVHYMSTTHKKLLNPFPV